MHRVQVQWSAENSDFVHNKIKYSCAVVGWIGPGGQCLETCLQTGFKTLIMICRTIPFVCEQRSTMAGKVNLSEYVLDLCDIGWGNSLITVLCSQQFSSFAKPICGHTQSTRCYNI